MAERTRVPRASIACTILDDPDLIALLIDSSGIQAYAVFTLLLVAAKVQDNGGVFRHPPSVVAMMLRMPLDAFTAGVATLLERTDWVARDATSITIRSWSKWNSWGGSRPNAGRKSSRNQARATLESSGNQDAIKSCASVSVSVVNSPTLSADADDAVQIGQAATSAAALGADTPLFAPGCPTIEAHPPAPISAPSAANDRVSGHPKRKRAEYPADFEAWWLMFPSVIRDGKGQAARAWAKLDAGRREKAKNAVVTFCEIVEAAASDRQQYFKRPESWLNSASWETNPAVWRATARIDEQEQRPWGV